MAGDATIGALKVDLGLDSAQFETGLKSAKTELKDFEKKVDQAAASGVNFGKMLHNAFTAAPGVALAGLVKGLNLVTSAIGNAIERADLMGKTAARIGLTTEALTRLDYAASHNMVTLAQLQTGFTQLSRNMANLADAGGNTARSAFIALGVELKNVDGTLRSSLDVFGDVADRFSRMEDSAEKTRIATLLFGEAGVNLIPMLNNGRESLAALADEADRFGVTISTETSTAAARLTSLVNAGNKAWEGMANRLFEAVLPGLEGVIKTFNDPNFQVGLANFVGWIGSAISAILNLVNVGFNAINDLTKEVANKSSVVLRTQLDVLMAEAERVNRNIVEMQSKLDSGDFFNFFGLTDDGMRATIDSFESQLQRVFDQITQIEGVLAGRVTPVLTLPRIEPLSPEAVQQLADAAAAMEALKAEGKALTESLLTPFESMNAQLVRFGELLNAQVISTETFDQAVVKAFEDYANAAIEANEKAAKAAEEVADRMRSAFMGTVSNIGNALGSIGDLIGDGSKEAFETAKQFHLASAIVAGLESVVNSFNAGAKLGGPILGGVWAGLAAITAAAQVAAVANTSFNSKSMSSSAHAVSAPSAPQPTADNSIGGRGVTVNLQGRFFDRAMLEELFREINDLQRDGGGPILT